MSEVMSFVTLWQQFGPSAVLLGLGLLSLRAIWPYLRDTYLPGRLAALNDQATAFRDIAKLVGLMREQLTSIEQRLVRLEDSSDDTSGHIEAIREQLRLTRQPTRKPRPES